MVIDEAWDETFDEDDEALERSAAYDELLRKSMNASDRLDGASILSSVPDGPTAGIIRLLHEVFRTPRNDLVATAEAMPERVGRFVIHRLLGRGAFGCVYLAHDPILRRQVALKVFHQHLLADESTRRHVLREREIMARLQHPNIVPVWEAGEENELLYIASEYCPGPTLAQWLADREQRATELGQTSVFSPEILRQCASWIFRLADAVHHSHERGVVHRDLKPGNVLLEPQGDLQGEGTPTDWRPRLTDFGLAKYFHAVQDETRTGLFIGSLEYASPEQVRGRPDGVGPSSDIYSLGVLLFELLTDEMPHKADSDYELARKICDEDVAFGPEHQRSLPRDLQAIALRALEREPRDRYASAAEMRDDLQRFLSGEFIAARHVSLIERSIRVARRNPDVALLSGLCICFALLLVGVLVRNNQQLTFHSNKLRQALVESHNQRSTARTMQIRAEESETQAREVGYQANMRLAYEAWEENNLTEVLELLEHTAAAAPSCQGFDWYLLHQELRARYKSIARAKEPIYGLVYDANSGSLLTANESGQVCRWDLQSRGQTEVFQAGEGPHAIALSPNAKTVALGQHVASKFGPSMLALWDFEHGMLNEQAVHRHPTTLESIEYSPDGKWIASGARYQSVILSNLENGEAFAIPSERRNTQLAFSPTGDRLAVNSQSQTIEIYDVATRRSVLTITTEHRVASYVWVPGREVIAINARGNMGMFFYSTQSGELVGSLPTELVGESLTASADGRWLALGSEEGRLQTFDLSKLKMAGNDVQVSAEPIASVNSAGSTQILNGFVTDIKFVDKLRVAASDELGNLVCVDPSAHGHRRFARREGFWTSARWESEDSLTAFSRTHPPKLFRLRGTATSRPSIPLKAPLDMVESADGKLQAAFTQSGELAVVDTVTGMSRFTVRSHPGNVSGPNGLVISNALISRDNKLVYTTGENNRLTAWNAIDGTIAWETVLTNTGCAILEDPDSGHLFVGGNFENLQVYNSRTGELIRERGGGNGSKCLVMDLENRRIISGHSDGTLRIQDMEMSQQETLHRSHGSELNAVTLSPDGRAILSGDVEGIIRVWHFDGQLLGAIYRSKLAEAKVQKFAWSPSGKQLMALITGQSGQSEMVCWNFEPLEYAAQSQAAVQSSVAEK